MLLITGPTGTGFVRYHLEGTKNTTSDDAGSGARLRHDAMPVEYVGLSYPYTSPINFTSLLYPIQFGVPYLFYWRVQLETYGTGGEQQFGAFVSVDLSLEVFDSNGLAVTDVVIAEVPEPRAFLPVITALLGLGLFRYRSSRRARTPRGV